MKHDEWYKLRDGYALTIGTQRRKRGTQPPPRFLVLAPLTVPGRLRKTVCAGSIDAGGAAIVDHGVCSDDLREQIEASAIKFIFSGGGCSQAD
jgi:hypothetical protein